MSDTALISGVTFVYLLSFLLYLVRLVRGREFRRAAAFGVAALGLTLHTAAILIRWKTSYDLGYGHAPLSNLYESLSFFAWAVVLLCLIAERKTRSRAIGVFMLPVAFLLLAFASLHPGVNDRIQPLIPALQSNWLTIHVVTCFLGYAGFTAAFALGSMYLIKSGGVSKSAVSRLIPEADRVEELLYQSVVFGFVLLTLGIMTGSVWAHYAWGSYWSWDPKETWSLVTWIVYALMLHARLVRGWRGRRMAVLSLIGFACVLFTYLGVNYLNSLHSYF